MSPAGQLLLPALVLLPLLALLPAAWHGGGLDLIGQFLLAAVQPSTDPALIAASLRGIAITVAVALWSWLFSLFLGVIAGVLSAEVVSRTLWGCSWPALLLRRLLAIPRSSHELLWGLQFGVGICWVVIGFCRLFMCLCCLFLTCFTSMHDFLTFTLLFDCSLQHL